jgi:hypothetical protein
MNDVIRDTKPTSALRALTSPQATATPTSSSGHFSFGVSTRTRRFALRRIGRVWCVVAVRARREQQSVT